MNTNCVRKWAGQKKEEKQINELIVHLSNHVIAKKTLSIQSIFVKLILTKKISEKETKSVFSTLSVGLERCWLYPLQKDKSPSKKRGVLGKELNYNWYWESSYGDVRSVEYSFTAIFQGSFWPTVVVSVKVQHMSQIDLFKKTIHIDWTACKKNLLTKLTKTVNLIVQQKQFSNL